MLTDTRGSDWPAASTWFLPATGRRRRGVARAARDVASGHGSLRLPPVRRAAGREGSPPLATRRLEASSGAKGSR